MVAAAVLATACSTKGGGHDARDGADSDSGTDLVCNPGTRWEPGQAAFREVTSDWGLDGVVGIRLAVTDIDGDGWPDLLVRNGGGPDDFSEGGERSRFVLLNTTAGTFEDVAEASGLLMGRVSDDPLSGRPGQTFAFDGFFGWTREDGTTKTISVEEMVVITADGAEWLIDPQEEWILISGEGQLSS